MGKKREARVPRSSWATTSDKLSGIRRDPNSGIVLARERRHPLADLFRNIPMGQGLPGMKMMPEAEHLLAIHVFDNLQCSPPRDPLYKARVDRDAKLATGIAQVIWVPRNTPDPDPEPEAVDETTVTVADISGYSVAQIEAMKHQIREEEIRRKLAAQADDGAAGTGGAQ